jgi:hypothetical protein
MMKKLGKTLIVISLILLVTQYAWNWHWSLRIEPAGNPIQLFFLARPYWFNRIYAYIGYAFANSHMELFWLGFALWFVGLKEESE